MRILVTGASGFIGGRFARFALEQGLAVRVNGRRAEPLAELIEAGAEFMQGDLGDAALASQACAGMEAVVHCAGAVGVWGTYEHFHRGNVQLTDHIIAGCREQGVRRLVHLSSPSIYFDGQDHVGIREEHLPARFSDHYGETKYLAEQRVFAAQAYGLEVLALRPRFVTGAGDTSIFPRLINMQRRGRLSMIGDGHNRVDFTSIGNLNQALLLALRAEGEALGKAYNISNGQPQPFWPVLNQVLAQFGLPPVSRKLPHGVAYSAAAINEWVCRLLPGRPEPALFRMGVNVMARNFSLDIGRAQQLLGYQPAEDLTTTLTEFCDWWRMREAAQA